MRTLRAVARIVRAEKPPTKRTRAATMLHPSLKVGSDQTWLLVPVNGLVDAATVAKVHIEYMDGVKTTIPVEHD